MLFKSTLNLAIHACQIVYIVIGWPWWIFDGL